MTWTWAYTFATLTLESIVHMERYIRLLEESWNVVTSHHVTLIWGSNFLEEQRLYSQILSVDSESFL